MRRALFALVLPLATLAGLIVFRAGPAPSADDPVVPAARRELDDARLAERLAGALRIPTVAHPAATADAEEAPVDATALRELHAYLAALYPRTHADLVTLPAPEGSLLLHWPGADPELAPFLVMGHLDVVPVEPGTERDWTHPPFAGVIADGFVWGRGALDDKVSVLAILEATELLLAEGLAPERGVYLAFGHDEETGGRDGAAAMAALLAARGVRLAFTLDEGMGIAGRGTLPGLRRDLALIAIAEKGYLSVELVARGEGGHSSTPPRRTSVGALARAVARLEAHPLPASWAPPVVATFDALAAQGPFAVRAVLGNRWLFGPLLERALLARPATAALMRTTTAPTLLRAGVKDNVLPSQATAVVNFRILPGQTVDDVLRHVRETLADAGVAIHVLEGRDPTPLPPLDTMGFHRVSTTVREVFPGALVAPALSVAGTDSKHYVDVADVTLRFLPLRLSEADAARIHGTDERIAVAMYADVVRFFVRLIENASAR